MQDRGMEGNGEKKRPKKVVRGTERQRKEREREKEEFSSGSFPTLPCTPHSEEEKSSSRCGRTKPGHPRDVLVTLSQRWPQAHPHGPSGYPMTKDRPGIPNPSLTNHQSSLQGFQSSRPVEHPGFHRIPHPLQRTPGRSLPPPNPPRDAEDSPGCNSQSSFVRQAGSCSPGRLSHQINWERHWERGAAAGGVCPCEAFAAANLGFNQSKCSYGYIAAQ